MFLTCCPKPTWLLQCACAKVTSVVKVKDEHGRQFLICTKFLRTFKGTFCLNYRSNTFHFVTRYSCVLIDPRDINSNAAAYIVFCIIDIQSVCLQRCQVVTCCSERNVHWEHIASDQSHLFVVFYIVINFDSVHNVTSVWSRACALSHYGCSFSPADSHTLV